MSGLPSNILVDDTLAERTISISAGENFLACASLAPLALGHLLIVPTFRASSIAEATTWSSLYTEFTTFHSSLLVVYRSMFPGCDVINFEHGRAANISGDTSQAHLHMLPLPASIRSQALAQTLASGPARWDQVSRLYRPREAIDNGHDYLIVGGSLDSLYMRHVRRGEVLEPQFLRRRLGELIGNSRGWHWRLHPNRTVVSASVGKLRRNIKYQGSKILNIIQSRSGFNIQASINMFAVSH